MKKKRSFSLGILAFLPFAAVVICYEIFPLLQTIGSSFIGKESQALGLENYVKIFTTPLYQRSILNSVVISLISAAVGLAAAFFGARFIHESGNRGKKIMEMILNMTSNFSGVPLAFAYMVLMGNTGFLTLIGRRLGIGFFEDFDLYSSSGLRLVYIYFQIPLATLLLLPAFNGVRKEWREASTILEAPAHVYWFRIVLPNLLPSILGTLSVLFANALAAYATAYSLVQNNYPLLSLQLTAKYKGDVEIDRATGGALSCVLILLIVATTLINNALTKRSLNGRER